MKCTCFKKDGDVCRKETGIDYKCVEKYKNFSPKILYIFFKGTEEENNIIPYLDALVCDDHMPEWKEYLKRSRSSRQAAKKRTKTKYKLILPTQTLNYASIQQCVSAIREYIEPSYDPQRTPCFDDTNEITIKIKKL